MKLACEKGLDMTAGKTPPCTGGLCSPWLENNHKKAFEGEVCSSFWGVHLDGRKELMRPNQMRLWPSNVISFRVCALGLRTISSLET